VNSLLHSVQHRGRGWFGCLPPLLEFNPDEAFTAAPSTAPNGTARELKKLPQMDPVLVELGVTHKAKIEQ